MFLQKLGMAIVLSSLFCWGAAALSADLDRGRLLYDNHCTTCHESVVHIRADRKAQSLPEITWQITRWVAVQKLDWSYAEVRDVLSYLNASYYHFADPGLAEKL